jgi:transposase
MALGNENIVAGGDVRCRAIVASSGSDPARPQRHWLTCRDPTSVSQTKASFIRRDTTFGKLCRQPGPTPAGESHPLDHREVVLVETVKACWLRERTPQFRDAIEFVAIDSVKIANDADQGAPPRPLGPAVSPRPAGRPGMANRRRLMRARERLSDKSFAKMCNAIVSEDDTGQILSAWIAEEELLTLATTIDIRWPEMNVFIATGITNARTEGYNRLVKQVKRAAADSATPKLGSPDTIPLHRQPAGRNPDFKLARSKSKTTYEARRGGTECGVGGS